MVLFLGRILNLLMMISIYFVYIIISMELTFSEMLIWVSLTPKRVREVHTFKERNKIKMHN